MNKIVLDYDGYICKSFYANKEDMTNFDSAEKILKDLVAASYEKACEYFNSKNVKIYKIVSGHSWKKDVYPSYKRSRKRDEFLGIYRQMIIDKHKPIMAPQLEADELIVAISDYSRAIEDKNIVVFSDDKDIRYYTEKFCKINILEQIQEHDIQSMSYQQLIQMLVGDKEDNISGVPKVGEKTAPKLLEQYGFSIDGVISIYKDKGIEIDQTLRDLLLIIPMSDSYLDKTESLYNLAHQVINSGKVDDLTVMDTIINQIQYLNKKVTDIYNKED